MYGGHGKLGRGGGRGGAAGKRHSLPSSFPPLSVNRQALGPSGRLSMGGTSAVPNRGVSANGTTCSSSTTEETFSLVTGKSLNFAMIFKLVPDLIDEIKRLEDQGGTARIKFDSNINNPTENVIEVGSKIYKFTWSHETGDLCDIYEERQVGEDGNGLLVESGCAWRKVNVERTLDESTKNHVKKLSEEAERRHKSRKAIILDHANPSMKNQMKAVAAAEINPWRKNFNQKKEPNLKKRKVELPIVGGSSKAANKISLPTNSAKSMPSVSPLPSPPAGSPFGLRNSSKHSTGQVEKIAPSLENELPNRHTSVVNKEKSGPKGHVSANPTDLQSMLISLLIDNSKGMSLKALEKAIGESMPNSVRKIEPIIRKIANFEAPGKYILKPGVELGIGKKPPSIIGSSPEDASHQTPASEDNFDCIPAAKLDSTQKAGCQDMEKQLKLKDECREEVIPTAGLDDHSFDIFGNKRNSDNSEKESSSSSDSGSDSESESSDSGSGSESDSHGRGRSKSKSPVGSGSSSDSESDDSKEGSDEDVDIMTSEDDQVTKQKLPTSISPIIWEDSGTVAAENGVVADMQDGDLVDIKNDTPDHDKMEMTFFADSDVNKESEKYVEHHESPMSLVNQPSMGQTTKDGIKHREADSYTKLPKGKDKRSSEANNTFEKSRNAKRAKTGGSETWNSLSMESPQKSSINTNHLAQLIRTYGDDPNDPNFQKNHNVQIPARKPIASNSQLKGHNTVEGPNMHGDRFGYNNIDYAERNTHVNGIVPFSKNKFQRGGQVETIYYNEKMSSRNPIEDDCQKPLDTPYQKYGEQFGKVKESVQVSKPLTSLSLKDDKRTDIDKYPSAIQGRGRTLQRELSELELGEFREPLLEVTPEVEKQIELNNLVKQSEDETITDPNKWKPDGRRVLDQGKKSNPIPNNQESLAKKKFTGNHTKSPKLGKSQQADMSIKPRNNEVGGSHDFSVNGGDINHKLAPKNTELLSQSLKNGRKQKPSLLTDLNGQHKDTSLPESTDDGAGLKRRESSSDENSSSYSKYEKASPELKGPIKDYPQYLEYVQEYQAKYESYSSLNKTFEGYRNEFDKLGKELESAKAKDMSLYYIILRKLNESYLQCGPRHKRLKKIFIVLHEELKNLKQMIKDYVTSYANKTALKCGSEYRSLL